MRKTAFFLGFALFLSGTAGAQSGTANGFASPATSATLANAPAPASASQPTNFFASIPAPLAVESAAKDFSDADLEALPAQPEPQTAQGVFQEFDWEGYVGFTYVRFFQVPGTQLNTEGLNFSVQYYFKSWLAADGEFVGTFGHQLGCTSKYLMGMGGVRVRKQGPYGIEFWAHALIGGAHYLPQTAYGNQHAWAYEAGGGADLNPHNWRRMAYRIAVDAAGTNYFNTYQVSPKVSFGVLYKF